MKSILIKYKEALIAFLLAASPLAHHFGWDINVETLGSIIDNLITTSWQLWLALSAGAGGLVHIVKKTDPEK